MAKKRGRPESDRTDATARIDVEVLSRAKVIAGYEKKTVAEWLTETLRPIVDKGVAKIATELGKKPLK